MREDFTIEIHPGGNLLSISDTITGYRGKQTDTFLKQDIMLESGKAYGLVSEYGLGCEFVSFLIGGKLSRDSYLEQPVLWNGTQIAQAQLAHLAWEIEPCKTRYEKWTVKKSIEDALKQGLVDDTFASIASSFGLTEARYDRSLHQLSGERWFASMAIGYALGRRIFFAPYQTSLFYQQCAHRFRLTLAKLKQENCLVLLPCGSDRVLRQFTDQCISLDAGIG